MDVFRPRLLRVGQLDVCAEGLRAAAGQCAADASRLASDVPSGVAGPSAQGSAVATSDLYTKVAMTAAILAARVHATCAKLTAAATQYVTTDETSAQRLSLLGGGPAQP